MATTTPAIAAIDGQGIANKAAEVMGGARTKKYRRLKATSPSATTLGRAVFTTRAYA